ncbi:2-phosphosulfolactate phosphatase [Algoriphagus iocasae]|jgi:2-phosphosulfolactate phosphatase|uniref:Probable 2-phosphosulfolactate phosphatase n=1 Tax=Algoriphagus iocasae TaxID=1836499 RepID=A0A841MEF5_9BACT|nr:2-phosphosulfolactate phosphatase [Algoriphagus iocasae]MBB6325153.1 2-phosphosulfolactate phosphatase [Algoriphagus iocasae]
MRKVEICFSPELIHLHSLQGKIVVVVDIFRATSTMVAALANGISEIRTFADLEDCRAMKEQGFLIAGERNGLTAPGFEMGNSPVAYLNGDYEGRKLAMTTTNGTLAISKSSEADEILIGAFPNLGATIEYLQKKDQDVLIHCAGWKGMFNLEDSLYAGALVKSLEATHEASEDGALAMKALFEKEGHDLKGFLSQASHAKRLQNHNIESDIDFCLTLDLYSIIGKVEKEVLIAIEPH